MLPTRPMRRLGREVIIFDQIDSTNAYLLAREDQLPDGAIVCAEFQSAGRGRLSRRWKSPRGSSILLSVLLKEPADSPLVSRATMLVALAACEAVELATVCRPALRWPNDLVLSGRKLGGVLVESTPIPAGPTPGQEQRAVAIGVGINCLQQRGHFTGELAQTATSLEIESAQPIDRPAVARGLLERLDAYLSAVTTRSDVLRPTRRSAATLGRDAWPTVLAAWKSRCEDIGARVRLRQDRRTWMGTVLDINDDGDLLVQLDRGGRRYFASATTTRLR